MTKQSRVKSPSPPHPPAMTLLSKGVASILKLGAIM